MARQTTQKRKHNRVESPMVLRKSPRMPKRPSKVAVSRSISPPVAKPTIRDTHKSETKQTVSAAGIFKKQPKRDRQSKKHQKLREESPASTLLDNLQDGITEAHVAIGNKAKATFDDIHASFIERLAATRTEDEAFFERMTTAAKTFSTPLEDEKVQSASMKGGKRIEEIFRIGDLVTDFEKTIEKEAVTLTDLWKQWDDVQNEYLELGIDVFGREAFGVDTPGHDKGFKKEMILVGLEHDARVGELEEEIESMGTDIMEKMKASEKELSAAEKKDQARLLQALF